MKICYVSCSVQPIHYSGVATWIVQMSGALKKQGHDIHVFTATFQQGSTIFESEEVCTETYSGNVVNVRNGLQKYTDYYRDDNYINYGLENELEETLNKIKPDLVHFHALQGMGANLIKKTKELGYKTILSAHDWWFICPNMFMVDCNGEQCYQKQVSIDQCETCIKKVFQLEKAGQMSADWQAKDYLKRRQAYLKHIFNNYVDCFLPVSETIKQYYDSNELVAKKTDVFENGTEVENLSLQQEKIRNDKNIVIGYVGGNVIAKGFWVLLEALSQLENKNWELHAYGYGCDEKDPDIQAFLSKEENSPMKSKVKLMKAYGKDDKQCIYQSFDLLVMPSISLESFSLVVREAILMQLPTIITACGGPEEVIEHDVNGWVVEPNNSQALAMQLSKILQEPTLLDTIKEKIDAKCIKTVEQQAEKLQAIYKMEKP